MDAARQLGALLNLIESLGITIRRAPAAGDGEDHPGGALVRLKGKQILFLDPTASLADQISAAAAALRGRPELEDRFLPPEIRAAIEGAGPAEE